MVAAACLVLHSLLLMGMQDPRLRVLLQTLLLGLPVLDQQHPCWLVLTAGVRSQAAAGSMVAAVLAEACLEVQAALGVDQHVLVLQE